ncbi:hypothetical protein ABT115_23265 [Streptomyces sp. NPDC001832]|uniref:hypothetical protein n=1 Tax=Streptomyces sp. NPDC001832 TaxID=3154527 RepID=UPI00332AC6AF
MTTPTPAPAPARAAAPPTTPAARPVRLLLDGDDDHAVHRAAYQRADPARGRITVDPTPHTTSLAYLALDLLRARGRHRFSRPEAERMSTDPAWKQRQNLHNCGHTAASLAPGEAAALTRLLYHTACGHIPDLPAEQIPRLANRRLPALSGEQPTAHPDVLFALAARPLTDAEAAADGCASVPAADPTPPPRPR